MNSTKIEWAQATWNPITGCTPVSEGCANCYARRMATRLRGRYGYPADDPFRIVYHHKKYGEPLRWKKPRLIFVCSMGDLFHKDVDAGYLSGIFWVMKKAKQHTFLLLTKRPENVPRHKSWWDKNIWLGVSAENQQRADERIPILLQIPAAVRFVSVEPMLGPVVLPSRYAVLDWVICGGETGPGARPMRSDWARSLRDQCQETGVPFFFKRWGKYGPRGHGLGVYEGARPKYWFGGEPVFHENTFTRKRLLDGREWNDIPVRW